MSWAVQDGMTYVIWCLGGYGLFRLLCDLTDWLSDVLRRH